MGNQDHFYLFLEVDAKRQTSRGDFNTSVCCLALGVPLFWELKGNTWWHHWTRRPTWFSVPKWQLEFPSVKNIRLLNTGILTGYLVKWWKHPCRTIHLSCNHHLLRHVNVLTADPSSYGEGRASTDIDWILSLRVSGTESSGEEQGCVWVSHYKAGGKQTNELPRDMSASTAAADPLKATEATNLITYQVMIRDWHNLQH